MYELHYGSGGHGGPYPSVDAALVRARGLLASGEAHGTRIDVRAGVAGPLVAYVHKHAHRCAYCEEPARIIVTRFDREEG